MDELIEKLLDAISAIVDRDDIQWSTKKHMIETKLKSSEHWETNWEEFMSWWETPPENDPQPAKADPKPRGKGK